MPAAVQVLGAERDVGRPIDDHLRESARARRRRRLPPTFHPITRAWPSARRSSAPSSCSTSTGARSRCLVNGRAAVVRRLERRGLAVFHDISESAPARSVKVARQTARLAAIVHLSTRASSVVDADTRLIFMNEAGRRMLDFREGMSLDDGATQPDARLEGRRAAAAYPSVARLPGET